MRWQRTTQEQNWPEEQIAERVQIKWSNPAPPSGVSPYNHVVGITALGNFVITWKSWKDNKVFDVDEAPGGTVGQANAYGHSSLEEAKQYCALLLAERIFFALNRAVPVAKVTEPTDQTTSSVVLDWGTVVLNGDTGRFELRGYTTKGIFLLTWITRDTVTVESAPSALPLLTGTVYPSQVKAQQSCLEAYHGYLTLVNDLAKLEKAKSV